MSNCSHWFGWQEVKRFRHYYPLADPFSGTCPKCKSKYDIKFLGSTICPDDGSKLNPEFTIWSIIKCGLCGEEKGCGPQ